METILESITTAIGTQQGLLLTGLGTVAVAGVTVALVKWGAPQAMKFFKRIAS